MSELAAFFSGGPDEKNVTSSQEKRARELVLLPTDASDARGGPKGWSEPRFAYETAAPQGPAPRAHRGRWRAAASLAAVVLIGAAAAAQIALGGQQRAETQALGRRLDSIAAHLLALDANRPRDDIAGLKKSLADIKAGATVAHEVGGAVAQLSARVDRLEKDQTSRIEKLDKDSTQRLADIAQRLDKLEAKTVATASAKTEVAKAAPGVSMEPTGSIEKPKPRLRDFYLADIRNGYAMIGGPAGEFAVAPGDNVPGGGRVLRIERHGRDWVVITTMGQIASMDD